MAEIHHVDIPGIFGRSHVPVVVVFAPETPDRTAAIRGEGPSPLPCLLESARVLSVMGATHFGVPCNTAHHFLRAASTAAGPIVPIPLIDMIEQAASRCTHLEARTVGLLATTGTVSTKLYQQALAQTGVRVLTLLDRETSSPAVALAEPGDRPRRVAALVAARGEQDALVMEAIYGAEGIKAGHTDGFPRQLLVEAARRLIERGADALILGCTEIPLVLRGSLLEVSGRRVPLIDATDELAAGLLNTPGVIGVAGGLGPEATIDLVAKLGVPSDFTDTLRAMFSATIDELAPARDQDHLRMYAAAFPDALDAAQRLRRAGATLLLSSRESAALGSDVVRLTELPVVSGPSRAAARLVVRAAIGQRAAGRKSRRTSSH